MWAREDSGSPTQCEGPIYPEKASTAAGVRRLRRHQQMAPHPLSRAQARAAVPSGPKPETARGFSSFYGTAEEATPRALQLAGDPRQLRETDEGAQERHPASISDSAILAP